MTDWIIGDRVTWNSTEGRITGKVTALHKRDFTFLGKSRRASTADPQYEVQSDKTGAKAAHKQDALTRAD